MLLKIFLDNDLSTPKIRALNLLIVTNMFVLFHLLSLQLQSAPFFKKTLSFIWTIYDLLWAIFLNVVLHSLSLDAGSTIIMTLNLKLTTGVLNVFVHFIQWQQLPALEQALNNSKRTFISSMLLHILSYHLSTFLTVRAWDGSVFAFVQMLIYITDLQDLMARLIRTINW